MPAFKIAVAHSHDDVVESTVDAAYYVNEDGFVTFKDDDHKQIASFSADRVVSVTRTQKTTIVGTVVVNVVPKMDEKAMRDLLSECDRRLQLSQRPASDGVRDR